MNRKPLLVDIALTEICSKCQERKYTQETLSVLGRASQGGEISSVFFQDEESFTRWMKKRASQTK